MKWFIDVEQIYSCKDLMIKDLGHGHVVFADISAQDDELTKYVKDWLKENKNKLIHRYSPIMQEWGVKGLIAFSAPVIGGMDEAENYIYTNPAQVFEALCLGGLDKYLIEFCHQRQTAMEESDLMFFVRLEFEQTICLILTM
jgi:hypothetical protein